ncbi:C40 family peptidase [Clostridium swellfunianum]|uniref:C40 family peptidase n=1 Tax=Clostridium swellfunianum TaxID=1367462 RepID=UPI00202F8AB6|nr:C40 family peptidase [Clostridium swellfunianum]MCM0648968.1 C40 family peptidase [Clostridium swellfunianum]
MKFSKTKPFIFVATVMAVALISKFTAYEVKADAAVKDQPSVVVRSASLNSDKTIKVPERNAQRENRVTSTTKKTTLNRGGSGLNQAGPKAPEGSNNVVAYAYKFLGKPYIWGASGPNAFDCSGFTSYVYKAFGVSLPHQSGSQYGYGKSVSKSNLAQGDLVFFNTYGSISHVGIYIGGGRFIHAGNSRSGVIVSSLSEGYYASRLVGAKRVLK